MELFNTYILVILISISVLTVYGLSVYSDIEQKEKHLEKMQNKCMKEIQTEGCDPNKVLYVESAEER